MAVTVYEAVKSRELSIDNKGASATIDFFALRSFDETEVYNAVLAAAPLLIAGLVRRTCHVAPEGGGFWTGQVVYEPPEGTSLAGQGGPGSSPPPPGDQPGEHDNLGGEFSFDTGGGTAHVTQSITTISKTGRDGMPVPDNRKAIGATKDKVEGVDVAASKLEFSFSRRLPFITLAYIKKLRTCTGKVNLNDYLGFSGGELLFMGASGQWRDKDGWTLNYKFAAAENLAGGDERLVICDGLVVPAKKGWDYLWVGYRAGVQDNVLIHGPDYAYVERVYKFVEFRDYLGW